MSGTCDAEARPIAELLGFSCEHANPLVTFRNPFELANWTLPVLELTVIAGALYALVHAIRRWRRDGDPTNLALYLASLVYLFVTEPPLYFPKAFGLHDQVGLIFVHNVFSVQFLYDRLPLYIVAFYPALSQVAYEVVRRIGVFRQRGPLAGAVCVALVYQAFYEIFDQLGPQLRWWAWNTDNDINHPMLASVPLSSVWTFASVSVGLLAYLVLRLVGQPTAEDRAPRGVSLLWRIVVSGVLIFPGMALLGLPTTVAGLVGSDDPNTTAQAVVLGTQIVLLWCIGIPLLLTAWRAQRLQAPLREPRYVAVAATVYLAVLSALWVSALPDYLDAVDGRTPTGTPIGNLPYVLACLAFASLCTAAALTTHRGAPAPAE